MSTRARVRVLLAGALVFGAALWLHLRAEGACEVAQRDAEQEPHARHGEQRAKATLSRADLVQFMAAIEQDARERAAKERAEHPHPITREHERLFRDVDLLHAADEAIKEGAFESARDLLARHHRELRGMSTVEEEGLLLLADCAQEPNSDNLARAQSFYDEHTESSVRRRLRRGCLELAAR